MNTIKSHKDLTVWQKSIDLAVNVYSVTKAFPSEERFGLISQSRRAAVSIPSNIAEGRQRGGTKEYIRFLRIALGSVAELETQLFIAQRLDFASKEALEKLSDVSLEITKMLKVMINKLEKRASSS